MNCSCFLTNVIPLRHLDKFMLLIAGDSSIITGFPALLGNNSLSLTATSLVCCVGDKLQKLIVRRLKK